MQTDTSLRLKNITLICSDRTETSPSDDSFPAKPTWDLSVYENRLRTFETGWVLPFITPIQMAKAGLYYMGKEDHVRCMLCSKDFVYWERNIDPYEEHKRVSPDCQFFKEIAGIFLIMLIF